VPELKKVAFCNRFSAKELFYKGFSIWAKLCLLCENENPETRLMRDLQIA
jgi:hypothetical protein